MKEKLDLIDDSPEVRDMLNDLKLKLGQLAGSKLVNANQEKEE